MGFRLSEWCQDCERFLLAGCLRASPFFFLAPEENGAMTAKELASVTAEGGGWKGIDP